jgi:hypothetical protein
VCRADCCSACCSPPARAQFAPPYNEYAAKFTRGLGSAKESDDVVAGVYANSINIHNPQEKTTVVFVKKIVVALREGTNIPPPVVLQGNLRPDLADRVDCAFIAKAMGLIAPFYVEGLSCWKSHQPQRAPRRRCSTSPPKTRRAGRPGASRASRWF